MTDPSTGLYGLAPRDSGPLPSSQRAASKVEETTQLDRQGVATTVSEGIRPPYDPLNLGIYQELNGTHARAIGAKSQWEVGFGFDLAPHENVGDDASDDQRSRAEAFWFGDDSTWKIGPEGTTEASPTEVLVLGRRDYHGIGWAAIEILTNNMGEPVGLAHVPAYTIRVRGRRTAGGDVERLPGYVQVLDSKTRYFGEAGDRWRDTDPVFVDRFTGDMASRADSLPTGSPANELIFVPNPTNLEFYYGIPDWVAEIQSMAADQEIKEYNVEFFDHSAIPHMAVVVRNGELSEQSRQDLQKMLDGLKGSPHRTVVLEVEKLLSQGEQILTTEEGAVADIRLEPLPTHDDASFIKYREQNEHDVAKVHGVPPQLINRFENSNRSNAREAIHTFANEEIAPEQIRFAERLYRILHVKSPLDCPDWTVEFELRGAENREREAQIAERRIRASQGWITVDELRSELDLDPLGPPIGDELVAMLQPGGGGVGAPGGAIEDLIQETIGAELDDRLDETMDTLRDRLETEAMVQPITAGSGAAGEAD